MTNMARAALFCATSCVAVSAHAQSDTAAQAEAAPQAATANYGVDEIIVTAQKRSERLLDVPLSITAISGDQLAKRGITSPADLERVVPGFTYQSSLQGTPVYQIRGIGYFDNQVAVSPTVTIYTDQAPIPYARMSAGASLDVERVEVLKGPQGTLFGQNSTGGAVNFIAAKPTQELAAGLDATYGRFNEVILGGFISGPVTDTLGLRVSGRYERRDGWQQSITRDDTNGRRDFLVGRVIADWQPTDRLQITLNVNGWRDRSELPAAQPRGYLALNPGPLSAPATIAVQNALLAYPYPTGESNRLADWDPGFDLRVRDDFYQVAGRIDYSLSDNVRLIAISSYSHLKTYTPSDTDATSVVSNQVIKYGRISSFSQELRLEGEVGDTLKWIVGGNYQRDKTHELLDLPVAQGTANELLGIDFTFNVRNDQEVRDIAVFGSLEYQLTNTLSLQGSARYNDQNRDFAGCAGDNGGPRGARIPFALIGIDLEPGACLTLLPDFTPGLYRSSLNEENVSWRGSINWKPQDDLLLYANVTRGFKAGTFGTLAASTFQQLIPVTQEKVTAYEAGFKTSLADRTIDLTGAVFYYDYANKQLQGGVIIPPFGLLAALINVPKSRVAGAELGLTVRPSAGLRLNGGLSYLSTKVLESTETPSQFGNVVDIKGESFPSTPKWQLQGDAEYSFDVGQGLSAYVGAGVSYRSATQASFGSRSGPPGTQDFFQIKDYALLDLRAGVNIGETYRLQVYGRNVTGTKYWTTVEHLIDPYVRVTGMPTTYGITASVRF